MPSNPAEELLAAVKEHATAGDEFGFEPHGQFVVRCDDSVADSDRWISVTFCDPIWFVRDGVAAHTTIKYSASSAVYSAFLRARGKHL